MTELAPDQQAARDALAQRLFGATIGALDLLHVYVGDRLGLYKLLADGPLTSSEVARRCGIHERYAREWLEQQAVAGVLDVDDARAPAERRRFALSPGHAEVLVNEDSLSFLAPLSQGVVSLAQALPKVLAAFSGGGGVPFEAYGTDIRQFISRVNRPMFLSLLATEWFPKVPGLAERLRADPPARVADVGCGTGWSSIGIAKGFPRVQVVGLDLDEASIADAQANAAASGVAEQITFEVRDAADPALAGTFDLVCGFETIHDMCDPVGALRAMRSLRADGGTVLIADERVADAFTTDADEVERFQWGWSALHCLPTALTAPPAAGTGTVMRLPTLRRYAQSAGFGDVEVLEIENDFWRFYRLVG